jgi:hypothetical protein
VSAAVLYEAPPDLVSTGDENMFDDFLLDVLQSNQLHDEMSSACDVMVKYVLNKIAEQNGSR